VLRHEYLELADAAFIAGLPNLAQQHRRRNPVGPGGFDAFEQIRLERVELRWTRLTLLVTASLLVAQVPPHRVP
jgi:hypothetical protein